MLPPRAAEKLVGTCLFGHGSLLFQAQTQSYTAQSSPLCFSHYSLKHRAALGDWAGPEPSAPQTFGIVLALPKI